MGKKKRIPIDSVRLILLATPPEFPPPFVVEKIRSLGYGSGPWQREEFVNMWQAPMADKFVAEAKAAGWLVSPARGKYFVPAAQDLTIVPWLPEPIRSEFLISRVLASAEIPFWCLSAWCRDRGLEFGYPLFVTDLGALRKTRAGASAQPLDRKQLRANAQAAVLARITLSFLDHLIVVPAMPEPVPDWRPQYFLATEDPALVSRRENKKKMEQATVALVGLAVWAITKEPPNLDREMMALQKDTSKARAISYNLGPGIKEQNWITALLASIGTARVEEFIAKLPPPSQPDRQAIQTWAGLMGPPQPNDAWRSVLQSGPFPFLLVPPPLWAEMGADQAARRFRMLDRLGVA